MNRTILSDIGSITIKENAGIFHVGYKGKMRKVYNILRIKQWKRKGHPTTDKINKRIKRLKVL